MIILDIETSGLDMGACGIWQIGAIDTDDPKNYFLEEARIDDGDGTEKGALKITGKTEKELRDSGKQSQKELILSFINWAKSCRTKIIVGQNIGWDLNFIQNKVLRYGIWDDFTSVLSVKGLDLYAIAQLKYLKIKGNFRMNGIGKGEFNLSSVMDFCGLKDTRLLLSGTAVVQEGTVHNALEDCRIEGECFYRLMYGRGLFNEFSDFKIPEYLQK